MTADREAMLRDVEIKPVLTSLAMIHLGHAVPKTQAVGMVDAMIAAIEPLIAEREAAARAEERERCARVLDDAAASFRQWARGQAVSESYRDLCEARADTCGDIAAAIRARS